MKTRTLLLAGLTITLAFAQLNAAVPLMTSYQGRVKVNGANFTGTGQFKFALIAQPGGASVWSNDGSSVGGSEPAAAVSLAVTDGLFTVLLGDVRLPNMLPLTADLFTANADVSLRVWFDDGVNGSVQLSPDTLLASAPYAMSADVADNSITGAHLAPGSIAPEKLASANAPAAGRVLTYDGAAFNWANSATAGSVWSVNSTNAYYNGGNVGVGTASPAHRLSLRGGPRWTDNGWTGALDFENGAALGWNANAAGQRFGMGHTGAGFFMFRTDGDPGTTGSPATYDFAINDVGNVGIGRWIPEAKLHVEGGGIRYEDRGRILDITAGLLTDITAKSTTLVLQSLGGSGNNHVILNPFPDSGPFPNGNVGVGTFTPAAKLHVGGDVRYDGALSKLDVAENFAAVVRAGDFLLGHSTRHGAPGRALVDSGTTLNVNFAGDWNTTQIGGATTYVEGNASVKTLTIRGGADLAEPFAMPEEITKGAVVVIDEARPGQLKLSTEAYDRRVAGVVSGANGINPGIALHQEGKLEGGQNVALSGRVYVQADAGYGAIKPGDLLTTSDTPGHAMKVTNHIRAQGAILGKAMTGLREGWGLVLVLVTLQ